MAKDTFLNRKQTLNCKGKLLDLSEPLVMGVLNLTPDSFYEGGRAHNLNDALDKAALFLDEGANIIDVGAYSSRSGAQHIDETTEIQRLIPVIEGIITKYPNTLLSVDTFRSKVAQAAVAAGASLVNDISAGSLDPDMMQSVAEMQVPYLMMHMKGTPQNMQENCTYDNIALEVFNYFEEKIATARQHGIHDLVIDPGFGFAKTIEQNFQLLSKLSLFKQLELPLLVGFSRKSMIYKTLETTAEQALNGTTVLNTLALTKGANILRVHDVKAAKECIKLFNMQKI